MRFNLTTRKILILTTLVAIPYVVYLEVDDLRRRDDAAGTEAALRALARYHTGQAAFCRGPIASTPYDKQARQQEVMSHVRYCHPPQEGWAAEAISHDEMAKNRSWFADDYEIAKKQHQSRLL